MDSYKIVENSLFGGVMGIMVVTFFVFCLGGESTTNQISPTIKSKDIVQLEDESKQNMATIQAVKYGNHFYIVLLGHKKGSMLHSEDCPCKNKMDETK